MYNHFYQFFALVLRVRQSCDHGALIPKEAFEKAKEAFGLIEEAGDAEDLRLDKEEAEKLLKSLLTVLKPENEELSLECGICLEPLVEQQAMAIRSCCHVSSFPCRHSRRCGGVPLRSPVYRPDPSVRGNAPGPNRPGRKSGCS